MKTSPTDVASPTGTDWPGHEAGSREYRRLLLALLCAGIAAFTALYAPQGVLPLVSASMRVSEAQSALLISAATIGLAAGVLPWSWVADRIGRLTAMRVAMLLAAVFGLAWILMPGFEAMLVVRVLQGVAIGGVPGLAITYLHDEIRSSQAVVAAATYVSGTTLGGVLGRMMAGPFADLWGWRWSVGAAWLVSALAAVGFVVLAPTARGFTRQTRSTAGDLVRNTVANLHDPGLLALYAQAFLLTGGFVAVYNFLGFRLEADPFGLSAGVASLLFAAYLAGTVSSRRAGLLAVRWGRHRVLAVSAAVLAAGAALTLIDSLIAITLGLIVLTAGFFGAHAIASGWVGARARVGHAQASSLYTLFYYTGSSVIGWAGGLLFAHWDWPGIVALVAGLVLLASLLSAAATRTLRT